MSDYIKNFYNLVCFTYTRKDWFDKWQATATAPWAKDYPRIKKIRDYFSLYYTETGSPEIDYDGFTAWALMSLRMTDKERNDLYDDIQEWSEQRAKGAEPDEVFQKKLNDEVKIQNVERLSNQLRQDKTKDVELELKTILDTSASPERFDKLSPIELDIDELLTIEQDNGGLRFRLDCLNRSIRPLTPGTFIIVAARPDVGKTSFISSEVTFMAPQLEGGKILWLNNEGRGQEIVKRVYQASLDATIEELSEKVLDGVLKSEHLEALGGGEIEVVDIHSFTSNQVEILIKERKPKVVIFDMLDNIEFDGTVWATDTRSDQVLEKKYQWARNVGVIYNCVVFATSQVSNDGDGLMFPDMKMLKDSKTGKQGAADVIIMVGYTNDGSSGRYISTPKNKRPTRFSKDPRKKVLFDGARSRFNEAYNVDDPLSKANYEKSLLTAITDKPKSQSSNPVGKRKM